jgi:hypothetical protein
MQPKPYLWLCEAQLLKGSSHVWAHLNRRQHACQVVQQRIVHATPTRRHVLDDLRMVLLQRYACTGGVNSSIILSTPLPAACAQHSMAQKTDSSGRAAQ